MSRAYPMIPLLLALAACGAAPSSTDGSALYASQGCTLCHGSDGAGTVFGPTLLGKKGFWTREKLVEYLKNPVAYGEKDKRLSDQARRFTLPMQRFDKLKPEELTALADHILSMP
ncbi:MAG TPA: cytochrome c [Thermoanaerobaculia bacterium]|nr:cytochrome c [Thermoanaerobaculia bacterium]